MRTITWHNYRSGKYRYRPRVFVLSQCPGLSCSKFAEYWTGSRFFSTHCWIQRQLLHGQMCLMMNLLLSLQRLVKTTMISTSLRWMFFHLLIYIKWKHKSGSICFGKRIFFTRRQLGTTSFLEKLRQQLVSLFQNRRLCSSLALVSRGLQVSAEKIATDQPDISVYHQV